MFTVSNALTRSVLNNQGTVVYVGITNNPDIRSGQHRVRISPDVNARFAAM